MDIRWNQHGLVAATWPTSGRHILASYDDDTVVVYQAYRSAIADYAVANQRFGGPFSLQRMSWIKPNFLWMMYRCGWAAKPDQERVLAIHLRRQAFLDILTQAVWSSFQAGFHPDQSAWAASVRSSDVRLQWDPDHEPNGRPCTRRAIQLGLRGAVLESYAAPWLLRIEDITPQVLTQRVNLDSLDRLLVPDERVFPIDDPRIRLTLGLDLP